MTFKAVNWTPNEKVGEAKMGQMSDNATYLYENTPRAVYTLPGGLTRQEGVKLVSGRVLIAKKMDSDSTSARVRFGNFFSTRCEPLITTGIIAEHQVRIFCVINGIGQLHPDHRGFNVQINIAANKPKHDKVKKSFYVAWQAMGY